MAGELWAAGSGRGARPDRGPRPALTPMIDVTFLLLLFFLLSFTFRPAEGQIPGSLPRTGMGGTGQRTVEPLAVEVALRPAGACREGVAYRVRGVAGELTGAAALHEALRSRARLFGRDVPVKIKVRADVRWQFAVEAYNQAVRARFKEIGFVRSN